MFDPLYGIIDAAELEAVRVGVLFNNLFVGTPFQAKLRRAGVWDPFLGGAGMRENILYGRTQYAAVDSGQTVTVTAQQINTGIKFLPKFYAAWWPMDDALYDDGSGTGGVINSGPPTIIDEYQAYMENMVLGLNTALEMDSFRHGQASSGTSITDNRIKAINGLDEALSNGIDPSVYGNIYKNYGGQARNGAIGVALNSTPLYLGNGGTPGQIDFAAMTQLKAQCTVTGGNPTLGITNTFGYAAISIALDAQRRDVSNKNHDIAWRGFNFDGIDIYADPLAPSAAAQNYIPLAPADAGQGNANLQDGVGSSTTTVSFTTPQFTSNGANVAFSPTNSNIPSNTVIQPSEVLYFLEPESFKVRPTNKSGWNYGIRRAPMPNNVSIDAIFMRVSTNLYNSQPRHNAYAFGFNSGIFNNG
jgi:hypothetical protein